MKKVINSIIPTEDYIAMTAWPIVFVQKQNEQLFDDVAENHENIHGRQQVETLIAGSVLALVLYFFIGWWCLLALPIFFYWYGVEYLLRTIIGKGNSYRNISFEREAYANERNFDYIKNRNHFAWIKYI